ncbi:penicillin acylase family protein [Janthinobacterium sp. 78]|uniref:penicillin acylase family protein n=1 Tax=Janthinobacterium sp. 78 TaxID=2135631 RepID=UPI000D5DF0A3|nr:penicillin acylase family protein [Janthinobacterium sp. 78]PVX37040.1 penicillin amidase [Janthinobacterium sp. 78]
MPVRRALFAAIACGIVASAPALAAPAASVADMARWQAQAANVSIARDTWGIPHVTGKSDADAVFGLMYAQAEDDFPRVELNYINAMGRLAEVEGERELYRDLRSPHFQDQAAMYARGQFKEVLFYPEDVARHLERRYRPGE